MSSPKPQVSFFLINFIPRVLKILNFAQGDYHIHNKNWKWHARLQVRSEEHLWPNEGLHEFILERFHDSAERYPPPNRHPYIRKAVREIILDWVHSFFGFWLYGKSRIIGLSHGKLRGR